MNSFKVIVVGAGRVGLEIAELLHGADDDFSVRVLDISEEACDRAAARGIRLIGGEPKYPSDLARLFVEHRADAVVAAVPDSHCNAIACAAHAAGAHYVDLVEEPPSSIGQLAAQASSSFIFGCGIAPGLTTQLLLHALSEAPWARHCEVSTGILSRNPQNRMGYELTWDVRGLIDEYCLPGAAIIDGDACKVDARSLYRMFDIGGVAYEAFVTGGLGSRLAAHLSSRLDSLSFLTIRRKGHLDYIDFLLDDLGLLDRKYMLDSLLRNGIPEATDDEVLILLSLKSGSGRQRDEQQLYHIAAQPKDGERVRMAGRLLAASHVAAVVDMLRSGEIDQPGIVAQESIPVSPLISNRFLSWLPSMMTKRQVLGPDICGSD